jgi:hypothetical protein
MKKIIPLLIALLMGSPTLMYGQKDTAEDPIIALFGAYEDREGVESITISPALFGLMKGGKGSDKKTQELVSKISALHIFSLEGAAGKAAANRKAFTAELQAIMQSDFTRIMMVKDAGERVELHVRNRADGCEDCKSALLFVTSASKAVTVMYLAGTIDKTLIDAVMNGEIGISNR